MGAGALGGGGYDPRDREVRSDALAGWVSKKARKGGAPRRRDPRDSWGLILVPGNRSGVWGPK